jgi:SAM-dependent methyltransferase
LLSGRLQADEGQEDILIQLTANLLAKASTLITGRRQTSRRTRNYYDDPERGLVGWNGAAARRSGLGPLLGDAPAASVLDLGCAEGLVAEMFLQAGARRLHGYDLDPTRIAEASRLFGADPRTRFATGNLEDWRAFERHADLDPAYHIVLLLGVYHQLPRATRHLVLIGALARCDHWLAFRTRRAEMAEAMAIAEAAGFSCEHSSGSKESGELHLWRRRLRCRRLIAGAHQPAASRAEPALEPA